MRLVLPEIRRRSVIKRRTVIALAIVTLVAIGLGLNVQVRGLLAGLAGGWPPKALPQEETTAHDAADALIDTVVFSPEKIEAAGLRLEPARVVELTDRMAFPGTIEADPELRVEIRPRVVGVVRSVEVALGTRVEKGDLLAVLESVEVGTARLDLRARRRELELRRSELEWETTVAENVERLAEALSRAEPASELERQFAGRPLGDDRATLLAAYADLEAARVEEERQSSLARDEIVGQPKMELARRARMAAQARFEAALEQIRYDARRNRQLALQAVRMAEADLADARHRLQMVGIEDEEPPATTDPTAQDSEQIEALTEYRILAPMGGTVVSKAVVPSQRVDPNSVLMTLVDLSEVDVIARVPESAFAFLPGIEGTIRFTAAAYPGREFTAVVHSVGAEVDPQTRTVPIRAHVPNPDGALRLGMFVRIELEQRGRDEALTVPASAVVEIDGQPAVFVAGEQPGSFVMHPVTPGRRVGDRREILSGLEVGREVVASGAFFLKSELILQNEPEED